MKTTYKFKYLEQTPYSQDDKPDYITHYYTVNSGFVQEVDIETYKQFM